MTDSVEHTPSSPPEPTGIPDVSPELTTAFLAEPHTLEELFAAIQVANPRLADFIMGRAEALAPHDPTTKEIAVKLAAELFALLRARNQASVMDAWLDTTPPDKP